MATLKSAMSWFFPALLALALNVAILVALPLLKSREAVITPYPQARPVRTVYVKRQEPLTPEKRVEQQVEKQPQKKRRPMKHPEMAQAVKPAHSILKFDVSPRLPDSRPMLSGLAIRQMDLPRPAMDGVYEAGDLDAPLTPVAQTPPVYPLRARNKGIEGWVKVSFVVMPDGQVADIHIVDAEPADIFENCVRQCIAKWRFSPGTIQGEPVKVKAETTMRFDLKG